MPDTNIAINEATSQLLAELAAQTGVAPDKVLHVALDAYRKHLFFEGLKADYAALKADPEAWAEELAERREWEQTLADGLDPDERWTEDGRCLDTEETQ